MEKYKLMDGVVNLTTRKVTADRKAEYYKNLSYRNEGWVLTYEPHGNSGKDLSVNELVYELLIIAGYDMLQAGMTVYGGDYTAAELAGHVGCKLRMFMENGNPDWEDYKQIRIKTKTFDCSFEDRYVFEQIAEWEGVCGISAAKAYRFHCEGKEMPKGTVLKKYTRCHGYKPTHISLVMDERRINQKFEVLGKLYQSLTSEGMRKAMSVCAAARLFDNKSYEVKALVKSAMRWKLWKDHAKKDDASMMPVAFSATDFQYGPECYKQVDSKYVQELVDHWNKMVADNPAPEWPKQGDMVQFKNRDTMQKKYQGKYLCEGMTASLSTYGDRIEWRASVRVKKYDNEYFTPSLLEPVPEKGKKTTKTTKTTNKKKKAPSVKVQDTDYTVKSDGRSVTFGSYIPAAMAEEPKTAAMILAEQLRQALLARLAA